MNYEFFNLHSILIPYTVPVIRKHLDDKDSIKHNPNNIEWRLKRMKKTLALLTALALLISAIAIPALAEETSETVDQVTSATANQNSQTGKGGHGGRQQMPGRNGQMPNQNGQAPGNGQAPQMPNQNGQAPQMPGQNGQMPQMPNQNGQVPQMPGQNDRGTQDTQDNQNSQQPQLPGNNGRGSKRGNRFDSQSNDGTAVFAGKFGKHLDFNQMLKDGVITQEVYDAIMAYMKEHTPQQQADTAAPAEGTAPAENTEPPALPDGATPAEGTEPPALPENAQGEPAGMEEQLLKELLDSGVITQEQYDLLLTKISDAETASET